MTISEIPRVLSTKRLLLRGWRKEDAEALLPILQANEAHLHAWIPVRIAAPVPLPQLEKRLAGFEADFDAGKEFRFAIFAANEQMLLGEAGLFPRNATGRVPLAMADRLEIGYWLRSDVTGRGYATEATQALMQLAPSIPGILRIEIHCDARNLPSAAIPRRLGFRQLPKAENDDSHNMVWFYELSSH